MGKTLQSITDKSIVGELIKAHASEWLAYYLYVFMANSISGNLYPELQDMLEEIAKEEYDHAQELADLIVKLGGKLIADPMTIEDNAPDPVIIPPDKLDLNSVCAVVAESEKNAIILYNGIAQKTKDTDFVVYQLISDILSDEASHEEKFENLVR
jgi:ferritin-like protein